MAVYPWAIDPWRPGWPDDFGAGFACTCEICGAEFTSARKSAKYCGEDCRKIGTARRLEERGGATVSPATVYPALRLAAAVCASAVAELQDGDLTSQLDALFWLDTDEARLYFEALGYPNDPLLTMNFERRKQHGRR